MFFLFKSQMLDLFTDVAFCYPSQQRMQNSSTAERSKALAMKSSDAEAIFQQLDKLRTIYDAYMKLVEETIPLAEKNLNQHLADESQKAQTFDDVSSVINTIHFQLSHTIVGSRAKRTWAIFL